MRIFLFLLFLCVFFLSTRQSIHQTRYLQVTLPALLLGYSGRFVHPIVVPWCALPPSTPCIDSTAQRDACTNFSRENGNAQGTVYEKATCVEAFLGAWKRERATAGQTRL